MEKTRAITETKTGKNALTLSCVCGATADLKREKIDGRNVMFGYIEFYREHNQCKPDTKAKKA